MVQLGVIHQLLDLLEKHVQSRDTSVQQAALSALQNLAIPVVSKVQMLEEGVAERIEALLRSESPPVQCKLLGTLRMLADGQGRHLPMFTEISYELPSSLALQNKGCARLWAKCPPNLIPLNLESFQQRLLPEAAHFPD